MTQKTLKSTFRIRKNYKDALAFVDNFSEQLKIAGQLQRDFLPKQLPDNQNMKWSVFFQPAEWVSGDLYDIVRLDEKNVGFYIFDVVGHGIPAALLTIFLKQSMQLRETTGHQYKIFQPQEVMANLNDKLCQQKLSGNQFATACYCVMNTETLEVTFCRAGHPYPIIVKQSGQLLRIQSPGTLLGIFDQCHYSMEKVQLEKGDKLLLYSDGAEPFIGYCDDNGEFIFHEMFVQLVQNSAEKIKSEFKEIVKTTVINPAEVDDVTLMVLETT